MDHSHAFACYNEILMFTFQSITRILTFFPCTKTQENEAQLTESLKNRVVISLWQPDVVPTRPTNTSLKMTIAPN